MEANYLSMKENTENCAVGKPLYADKNQLL